MGIVEFCETNSGGYWWLSEEDYRKLEEADWIVHWYHDVATAHAGYTVDPNDETDPHNWTNAFAGHSHTYGAAKLVPSEAESDIGFLSARATSAAKQTDDPDAAVAEWASITGKNPDDEGCNCCGQPFNFTFTDDDGNVTYRSSYYAEPRTGDWD